MCKNRKIDEIVQRAVGSVSYIVNLEHCKIKNIERERGGNGCEKTYFTQFNFNPSLNEPIHDPQSV